MRLRKALKVIGNGACGCHVSNRDITRWYKELYKKTGDEKVKAELDDFLTPTTGRIGWQTIVSYKTGCCLKGLKNRLNQLEEIRKNGK